MNKIDINGMIPGAAYLAGLINLGVTRAMLDGPTLSDKKVLERCRFKTVSYNKNRTSADVTYIDDKMELSFRAKK